MMDPQEIPLQYFGELMLLYGAEDMAITSLSPLEKSLRMLKSIFLQSFSKSINTCHRLIHPLIEIMVMSGVFEYMFKVQKSSSHSH